MKVKGLMEMLSRFSPDAQIGIVFTGMGEYACNVQNVYESVDDTVILDGTCMKQGKEFDGPGGGMERFNAEPKKGWTSLT